jgi:integrase
MPGVVPDALRQRRKRRGAERAEAGEARTDTGLVFTTATGRHVEPRNPNTVFGRLVAGAGVRPIRLHDYADLCVMPTWLQRPLSDRVIAREMSA